MSPDPAGHPGDWRDTVTVMIEDAERVIAFIGSMDEAAFLRDDKTVFAVCYAFVRLGEGAAMVPEPVRAAHPGVDWRAVRHFRNFMIHVYRAVDPARLYQTARDDLPPLIAGLRALLAAQA